MKSAPKTIDRSKIQIKKMNYVEIESNMEYDFKNENYF